MLYSESVAEKAAKLSKKVYWHFKVNGVSVYSLFAVATVDIRKMKRALLNFVKNSIYRF